MCNNHIDNSDYPFFASISNKYFFASVKKLNTIIIMIIPTGKAAIILTVWILLIELSEKTRAIGRRIRRMHHNNWMLI